MRDPISFSFILTQEDGTRIYGTCLNFDESIPVNLIAQLGHIEITKEKPLFIQKSIVIISRYPFLYEFKELLKQIYRVHLSKSDIPLEVSFVFLVIHNPNRELSAILLMRYLYLIKEK